MAKVAMIVPSEKMLTLAKPMLESYSHVDMVLLEHVDPGDSQKALKIARSAIAQGCELIIARGVQAMLIKSNTSVPVVEIQLTAQEVGSELLKMRELLNDPLPRIGLVILDNMVSDISRINELFPVELQEYYTDDYGALPAAVDRALADGCLGIIGGHTACARAEELGLMCRFLPESGESLRNAMAIASRVCYAIDLRKRSLSEMDTMLNNTFTGIMQVSRGGKIQRFNQSVSSLLGKEEDILHRSVTEVIPKLPRQVLDDALLHGKEKYAFVLDIRGKAVIVSIAPVFIDKEVDSAILTFQEEKRIVEMNSELRTELYQRGYIARFSFEQMVCKSKLTQDVIRTAKRIAGFQAPILLTGEAGVGKKILAQCIHRESLWRNSAFVSVDCSAWIPETVDDMLFGNYSTRKDAPACLAELAQNGTMFLDHVDAINKETQYKLLSLIQGKLLRNGSSVPMTSSIRIIASTEKTLISLVEQGSFRQDLYYALSTLSLEVPPLRKRREDIPGWIGMFLEEKQKKYNRLIHLTNGARQYVQDYDWPGNLDQMQCLCERIVLLSEKRNVDEVFLRRNLEEVAPLMTSGAEKVVLVQDPKALQITQLLTRFGGSRERVAQELGISKTTLWRYMKKYNIAADYK